MRTKSKFLHTGSSLYLKLKSPELKCILVLVLCFGLTLILFETFKMSSSEQDNKPDGKMVSIPLSSDDELTYGGEYFELQSGLKFSNGI